MFSLSLKICAKPRFPVIMCGASQLQHDSSYNGNILPTFSIYRLFLEQPALEHSKHRMRAGKELLASMKSRCNTADEHLALHIESIPTLTRRSNSLQLFQMQLQDLDTYNLHTICICRLFLTDQWKEHKGHYSNVYGTLFS